MSKTYYKIWTYIEKINEDKDIYEDVEEPMGIGEFRTLKEAKEFRTDLFYSRPLLEDEEEKKSKKK